MAEHVFYPESAGDDGYRNAADYDRSNSYLYWGDAYEGSFIRFVVWGISQGTTIASATLRLKKAVTESTAGTGSATIYGVDVDDQGQIDDGDEASYDALSLTSASTNVPAATYDNGTYYEWDITDAVQEIINRGSWAEASIALKIADTDTSREKKFYAYEYNATSYRTLGPQLVIETTGITVREVFYTAHGDDDGYVSHTTPETFTNGGTFVIFGHASSYDRSAFIRFQNVDVPTGATITHACIRLRDPAGHGTGEVDINVDIANANNQAAPTDASEFDALPLTGSPVLWEITDDWILYSRYASVDLKTLVQAVVNRSGWVPGNSMLFTLKLNSGTNYRYANTYESGPMYAGPELYVEWEPTGGIWTGINNTTGAGDTTDGMSCSSTQSDATAMGDTVDGAAPKGYTIDATALGDSSDAINLHAAASDATALGDSITTQTEYGSIAISDATALGDVVAAWSLSDSLAEATDLGDAIDGTRESYETLAEATDLGDAMDALNWTQYWLANKDKTTRTYELTLTGAADSKADVKLPMSSFQARLYSGNQSYLQVVVPSVTDYGDYVTDRPNGELVLEMVGTVAGTEVLRLALIRVDLEGVRMDVGIRSESITLEGHKTVTYDARTTALESVTYYHTQDGAYTFRCAEPDWWLRPGHTATYDGNSFVVDQIVTWASVTERSVQAYMEVNE